MMSTSQHQCGTPMVHADQTVSPCTLPRDHFVQVTDSDHYDAHGCTAPVLVHQASIADARRVQQLRDGQS